MKKGRELISLPVIDFSNGKQLGEVKELIICDDDLLEIKGLIIENETWFCQAKYIPYEDIKQITNNKIVIENDKVIKDIKCDKNIENYYTKQKEDCILGKKVINQSGESFGFIGDVLISTETGIIAGYEVSDGFVQDLLEGRNYIALPKDFEQDKESLHLLEDPFFINPLF